jgi:hypothetical protein
MKHVYSDKNALCIDAVNFDGTDLKIKLDATVERSDGHYEITSFRIKSIGVWLKDHCVKLEDVNSKLFMEIEAATELKLLEVIAKLPESEWQELVDED